MVEEGIGQLSRKPEWLNTLLTSSQPAIRLKTMIKILDYPPDSPQVIQAQQEMCSSSIIQSLFLDRDSEGKIPFHPYDKWFGAHWVLSILADLCYPSGDEALRPLLEQCYQWLLSDGHWKSIRTIADRTRRCASQEGNCIYYSLVLGLADDRTQELAERLLRWQWPDGGWNCDKHPEAIHSSFNETLIPLRALIAYSKISGDPRILRAVERSAEVFLSRQLFRRIRGQAIMDRNFVLLHYPCYWHYDILFGLKVMVEAGLIGDKRCELALDLLESKQLVDGSFPAEACYYKVTEERTSGRSRVNWGGTSKVHGNEFVTVDACSVLVKACRLNTEEE